MFWDCATISACETFPAGLPESLDVAAASERDWRARLQITTEGKSPKGTADSSIEEFWRSAVRSYTACSLTRCTDRMIAIWSVAKLVRDEMRRDYKSQDYGAGLWSSHLHAQLAWRVINPDHAKRDKDLKIYPTWSWASLIGEIEAQDRTPNHNAYHCAAGHGGDGIRFEVELPSGTPTIRANDVQEDLKDKSLAIKVKLVQVILQRVEDLQLDPNAPAHTTRSQTERYTLRLVHDTLLDTTLTDENFEVHHDTSPWSADSGGAFYMIVLYASKVEFDPSQIEKTSQDLSGDEAYHHRTMVEGTGLVLKKAPSAEYGDAYYERVAMCRFKRIGLSDFGNLIPGNGAGTNIWLI